MLKRKDKVLPVQPEQAVLALELVKKSGLEKKLAHQALQALDTRKLRKLGILGLGVVGITAAVNAVGQYTFYRTVVARELKRQLNPMRKKLDEIEAELKTLHTIH